MAFPVKVLKLLVHDLRSKSESVSFPGGEGLVDTDDEDEEWTEEEQQHQGFKADEFAFLSEMLGPRGANFDNDDIFDDNDDEDLKNDPISQIDMKVSDLGLIGMTLTLTTCRSISLHFSKTARQGMSTVLLRTLTSYPLKRFLSCVSL